MRGEERVMSDIKETGENAALLHAARQGLAAQPKSLEPKWFYDEAGSALFEEITELAEYYPTRTELAILAHNADKLARYLPRDGALVELGSGASRKTRTLIEAAPHLAAYLPIDISGEFLHGVARDLRQLYPALEIVPIVADFTRPLSLPAPYHKMCKAGFFPGSTIGNFLPTQAADLLRQVHEWPQMEHFIIGIDLVKDAETLIAAYDDAKGVTAAFNRNVLRRMNRELGANFNLSGFAHEARWNNDCSRIEMHLVSLYEQTVTIAGTHYAFHTGETIHTENSHKYTKDSFTNLAADTGWRVAEFITDPHDLFAVAVLTPAV